MCAKMACMAQRTWHRFRLAVDAVMVLCWGSACVLRLVALLPAHDWKGLAGLALLGFIAFAFAVDFNRVQRADFDRC